MDDEGGGAVKERVALHLLFGIGEAGDDSLKVGDGDGVADAGAKGM